MKENIAEYIYQYLRDHEIAYITHHHPALFHCADRDTYDVPPMGMENKNLFLVNKNKSRFFLVTLAADKKLDLKWFGMHVNENKISFGKEEYLQTILQTTGGSVSPFGLIFDHEIQLEVFVDKDLLESSSTAFHPNHNTESLEISGASLQKFYESLSHSYHILDFSVF